VSVILFGSAAKGGFSGAVSDVDHIIVLPDDASRATRRRLGARKKQERQPYRNEPEIKNLFKRLAIPMKKLEASSSCYIVQI
jgi:tRNA nucleotidyltransferase (CCA-adding enzyme)